MLKQMNFLKHIFYRTETTLIIITVVLVVVSSNINWGGSHWKNIIEVDGKGYYAYLPAVFIYHDLNFGFFDEIEKDKYYSIHTYYDYRSHAHGKTINKYYAGTAVAQLPFFFTAHALTPLFGFETDGYSKLYTILINLAGIFYLILGLGFVGKLLRLYGVGDAHRTMTFYVAVFGTNLFFYTVSEPGMSHIYSFAFIAMFLYYSKVYFLHFNRRYLVVLAAILGMIVLIRPVNALVVLCLPFVSGSLQQLRSGFASMFSSVRYLLFGILVFAAIISIQLIIYKVSTGRFFVYAYVNEGFNFLSPRMIDILFSYRKGLFVYTPIYLVSVFGLLFLWKSNRFEVISWVVFFLTITYVFSSWWMWYYGGSFSSRVYIEFLPFFMIPLACLFSGIQSKPWKQVFISFIVMLVMLCQIQTYQYRYNQIHWSEMNKEKYWDVFLRVDKLM